MPAPLASDLRSRVVAAYKTGNRSYEEIAEAFSVGVASVNRWLRLDRERGSVKPREHGGGQRPQIDADGEAVLRELLRETSDATLEELALGLAARTGKRATVKGVFTALKRMGFSRKKRPSSHPSEKLRQRSCCDGTTPSSGSSATPAD